MSEWGKLLIVKCILIERVYCCPFDDTHTRTINQSIALSRRGKLMSLNFNGFETQVISNI